MPQPLTPLRTSPGAAPEPAGAPTAPNDRPPSRWSTVLGLGTMALLTAWGMVAFPHQMRHQQRTQLDVSACLAMVNTAVLLDNMTTVPPTALFQSAGVGYGTATVVQRSPSAIGIELPADLAKDNPDLARFYATIPLKRLRHPICPITPDAREAVQRTLAAMYG